MISVITPVYNSEPFLRQCLDSLIAQTYSDWELLAVDDGSTDGSSDILREYEKKDARIRVFTQTNAGPAAARNVALREMRGDYVTFLDSDDWLERDAFQTAWKAAEETGADMVLWNFKRYENGVMRTAVATQTKYGYHGLEETKQYAADFVFCLDGKQYMPTLWLRMIRTSIIKENGLYFDPRMKRSEDTLFLCELNFYLKSYYALPDSAFVVYRMQESSITHSYVKDYIDMVDIMVNKLKANPAVMAADRMNERINGVYLKRLRIVSMQELQKNQISFLSKWRTLHSVFKRDSIRTAVRNVDPIIGVTQFGKAFFLLRLKLYFLAFLILYATRNH